MPCHFLPWFAILRLMKGGERMRPVNRRVLMVIIGLMLFAFFLYRFDDAIKLAHTFFSIISPFVIGLFMALLINLPMRFLDRSLVFLDRSPGLKKIKRAFTLTLSVLLVLAVISLLLVVIIPEVVSSVDRLIRVIPGLLKQLEDFLTERNTNIRATLGLTTASEGDVRNIFQQAYQFLIGGLSYSSGLFIGAAQSLLTVMVGLVFAIYLLFSKERIKNQFTRLLTAFLPEKVDRFVQKVLQMLIKAYSNFIAGQCLQATLSSLLTTLVLMVFGFPYAVLIGLITFVAAFIPVFGPYLSGVLGLLLMLTADPANALWFLLAFFVVQQIAGSVVYPRIMAGAVNMPSIWVLVAVTVGGGIWGIPGMLMFIPLAAVAYRLTVEAVKNREKIGQLATKTEDTP